MTLIIFYIDIFVIEKKVSFKSKHSFLNEFLDDLDKLNNLNPRKQNIKDRKVDVYDEASKLYSEFSEIYYQKHYRLSDDKRKKIESKYDPKDLFLDVYDYSAWLENEEGSADKEQSTNKEELTNVTSVPSLESDGKEVKEAKG